MGKIFFAKAKYDTAAVVVETSYQKHLDTKSYLSLGNMLAKAYRHNTELDKAMTLYSELLDRAKKEKELARFETLFGLKSEQEQNNLLNEKIAAQNFAMIIGGLSIVLLVIAGFALYRIFIIRLKKVFESLQNSAEAKGSTFYIELQDYSASESVEVLAS